MAKFLRLLTLMQVVVIVMTSDEDISQRVLEMLRDAASVTEDSSSVQKAVEMCGYKFCDDQYDCETQTSDLFCELYCKRLKNLEICPTAIDPNNYLLVEDYERDKYMLINIETGELTEVLDNVLGPRRPAVDWSRNLLIFAFGDIDYVEQRYILTGLRKKPLVSDEPETTDILIHTDGSDRYQEIAVDPIQQLIYYVIVRDGSTIIGRMGYDGSMVEDLKVLCTYSCYRGFAIDPQNSLIYYDDRSGVYVCSYTGTDCRPIYDLYMEYPLDMKVDTEGNSRVYVSGNYFILEYNPATERVKTLAYLYDDLFGGMAIRSDTIYTRSYLTCDRPQPGSAWAKCPILAVSRSDGSIKEILKGVVYYGVRMQK